MRERGEPPGGGQGHPRRAGRDADRPALWRSPGPAHGGGEGGRSGEGNPRAAVAGRGMGATREVTGKARGGAASPRLPSPPAALRTMADFWKARRAELESSIAAETRPELLGALAFEWMCAHGILAGLDHQPGPV